MPSSLWFSGRGSSPLLVSLHLLTASPTVWLSLEHSHPGKTKRTTVNLIHNIKQIQLITKSSIKAVTYTAYCIDLKNVLTQAKLIYQQPIKLLWLALCSCTTGQRHLVKHAACSLVKDVLQSVPAFHKRGL